ncbi:MAG: DoxX family protein [Candidatus Krumholzibacteriia bacterium]
MPFLPTAPLADAADVVLLLVRLVVGISFIYFGLPKIRDLRQNAESFVEMGFRPGMLWGTLIAVLEVFGGLAVIVGLLVWLVAAGLAVHMATGTVWKITRTEKGFPDWSYDLLLLALALVLLAFGPGVYSVHALLV